MAPAHARITKPLASVKASMTTMCFSVVGYRTSSTRDSSDTLKKAHEQRRRDEQSRHDENAGKT